MSFDRKIPRDADVMPISYFIECVKHGTFTDSDGSGHPTKLTSMSQEYISCNVESLKKLQEEGVTHIAWFNK